MNSYKYFNENPINKQVGDCTVRAISVVLNQPWEKTYIDLMVQGFILCDMPSANRVWGEYLIKKGFERYPIKCIDFCDYTVKDFCIDNPKGVYILATSGHVIAVIDGCYYDTWDSGEELPLYYWQKRKD